MNLLNREIDKDIHSVERRSNFMFNSFHTKKELSPNNKKAVFRVNTTTFKAQEVSKNVEYGKKPTNESKTFDKKLDSSKVLTTLGKSPVLTSKYQNNEIKSNDTKSDNEKKKIEENGKNCCFSLC